jgi:hypothetical protein
VLPQSQAPRRHHAHAVSSRFPPLFFIRLWAVNKKHQNEADFKKQKKRFKLPCKLSIAAWRLLAFQFQFLFLYQAASRDAGAPFAFRLTNQQCCQQRIPTRCDFLWRFACWTHHQSFCHLPEQVKSYEL